MSAATPGPQPRITIFTPTYNRAYILTRLYESLVAQTCRDFEWIVVDDCSTDDTAALLQRWAAEGRVNMRYILLPQNGGKHAAINHGVAAARAPWFFIVDSDDHLLDDAVEWAVARAAEAQADPSVGGISGTRVHHDGTRIGSPASFDDLECLPTELALKHGITGDMAEIWRTDVLRALPFPVFEGERFCPEALVWFRIADRGLRVRYYCHPTYVCEYLGDGLTASIVRQRASSPQASALFYSEMAHRPGISAAQRAKAYTNFWRFARGPLCRRAAQAGRRSLPFLPLGLLMRLRDALR